MRLATNHFFDFGQATAHVCNKNFDASKIFVVVFQHQVYAVAILVPTVENGWKSPCRIRWQEYESGERPLPWWTFPDTGRTNPQQRGGSKNKNECSRGHKHGHFVKTPNETLRFMIHPEKQWSKSIKTWTNSLDFRLTIGEFRYEGILSQLALGNNQVVL